MDLDGIDIHSIQYQNANNSVRVTDELCRPCWTHGQWDLVGPHLGAEVLERVPGAQALPCHRRSGRGSG